MSQPGTDKSKQNAFLSSMTFSSGEIGRGCDCDECDMIPADILQAIQRRKRQKVLDVPLMRTQDRTLVKRCESISVWKWTMPLNAEPLIEFGNSHRIIFVMQKPEGSTMMSIGKGVLGSSVETGGRSQVEWSQGKPYYVQSNGGKALGWIHTNAKEGVESSGHVVIYTIKVPLSDEKLRSVAADEESNSDETWVQDIFRMLAKSITDSEKRRLADALPLSGVEMAQEDSDAIAAIIAQLEVKS